MPGHDLNSNVSLNLDASLSHEHGIAKLHVPGTINNISQYMIKRAREIKSKKGILEEPDAKKGNSLSTEVIKRVIAFYQYEDYSRMYPGKKEYVSIKFVGKGNKNVCC